MRIKSLIDYNRLPESGLKERRDSGSMFEDRDMVRNMRRVRDLKVVSVFRWMGHEGVSGWESRRLARMVILVLLRLQTKLVNAALLNHLLVDCQLVEHFTALGNYLLLAHGEFGGQLVISLCQLGNSLGEADLPNQLVQHLHGWAPPPHMLGPAPLNR